MNTQDRGLLVVWAVLFTATTSFADLSISGLHNTGVDDNGGLLPVGTSDTHYNLHGASDSAYAHPIVFHPDGSQAWVTPPPGAEWIGPDRTASTYPNDLPGNYSYRVRFCIDLTGAADPSMVQLSGSWAADNASQILVNGNDTIYSKGPFGFAQLDTFTLTGFKNGFNDIEFLVNNESGPSGLLVAWRDVFPSAVVPEPSTVIAGALLILTLGAPGIRSFRNHYHRGGL